MGEILKTPEFIGRDLLISPIQTCHFGLYSYYLAMALLGQIPAKPEVFAPGLTEKSFEVRAD